MKTGTKVKIETDAVHQTSQRPLRGMTGQVIANLADESIIVSLEQLGGLALPFSEAELIQQ